MCGIFGQISTDTVAPHEVLHRVLREMHHRGPDGRGLVVGDRSGLAPVDGSGEGGRIALGHARLAIIDLHASASQPMVTPDGRLWIVFNGEIYNHTALRSELEAEGVRFVTDHSDTEVMLLGFRRWGTDLFRRLNGMFAAAWVDLDQGALTLARDRFGQKPLFLSHGAHGVAFGSDPRGLREVGVVTGAVDQRALSAYLQWGYVPEDSCIFEGVQKLLPGTWRRFALDGRVQESDAFWTAPRAQGTATDRLAWQGEFDRLLDDAVALRTLSDVPLGVFLSGGLDSARVVDAAARAAPIHTFTATFDDPRYDESEGARHVSQTFGTQHIESRVDPASMLDALDPFSRAFPEPFADSSSLALYILCRQARPHITVALGGDAGDELLGGYTRYRWLRGSGRWLTGKRAAVTGPVAGALRKLWPERVKGRGLVSTLHPDPRRRYASVMADEWLVAQAGRTLDPVPWPDPQDDVIRAAMASDRALYLPSDLLVKADRSSMASSLELRAPFLDHRLWDHVATAPGPWLFDASGGKLPIRHSVGRTLGPAYVNRPKVGFKVPLGPWFSGPLVPLLRDTICAPDGATATLFGAGFGAQLVRDHQQSQRDLSGRLWRLLMLELWTRHERVRL